MTIEQVGQALVNAGFIVTFRGTSFVVSLSTRYVSIMEVQKALNYADNVRCARIDSGIAVYVD